MPRPSREKEIRVDLFVHFLNFQCDTLQERKVTNELMHWPFLNKPLFLLVCITSLLKTMLGKWEIVHNKQFLLFPPCFLPFWRTFCHFHQIQNCHLPTLSVETKIYGMGRFKPCLLRVCSTSLLKTLWEKEKLLVTSNFSFTLSVFYPFGEFTAFFIKLPENFFSLEESKTCPLGKS